jgi:hypothetical protein
MRRTEMEQSNDQRAGIDPATETAEALMVAVGEARTTLQAYMDNAGGNTSYFKSMELLLRNYRELAQLVVSEELYMEDAKRERDKSVVSYRRNAGGLPPSEVEDEAERIRASNFAYTKERFAEIDRVVKVYASRKEMRVIRMYYFGQGADGGARPHDAKQVTFEDIAIELGIDEKTARRWRSDLVNDMAVALFGKCAAVEAGAYRGQRRRSLTSAG